METEKKLEAEKQKVMELFRVKKSLQIKTDKSDTETLHADTTNLNETKRSLGNITSKIQYRAGPAMNSGLDNKKNSKILTEPNHNNMNRNSNASLESTEKKMKSIDHNNSNKSYQISSDRGKDNFSGSNTNFKSSPNSK